ncbi:MAG: hypothetical protein OK422_05050 [Thaumarchaeota archaeon]|nr:hypothetical protein [Nitrososphaerota archaeon]
MPEAERRLVAVMFTDMVGYEEALRHDESLGRYLLEKERSVIRQVSSGHGGRYFGEELVAAEGTGLKGWLTGGTVKIREMKLQPSESIVLFESALDATLCAIEIQRALREYNREAPSNKDIYVRIGIDLGDITERDDQASGEAVAVASRITPVAEPGGICVSEKVYRNVRDKSESRMIRLGRQELKNVDVPIELYKIALPWEEQASPEAPVFDPHRLAILPLASISADPNDEYFADGMTEELISTTSSIGGLSLIARTSVMGYKGTSKKVGEIGRELSVGTVLEGSVRKAGNRLRITVQLIDVQSQGHLWAQSYDREFDDVFAVQSDIAKQVAEALKVRLLPSAKKEIERVPTKNSEAYVLYLKGRQYWNERSLSGLRRAMEYFKKAIQNDPNYAAAYAGLAQCHGVIASNGLEEPGPNMTKLKEYIGIALRLDHNLAEAHASQGLISFDFEYDQNKSEEEFMRALELNPSYATAHQWYGNHLGWWGRGSESYAELKRALELDPFSPIVNVNYGDYFRKITREYDRAVEQYKKALMISPGFQPALWEMMFAYARNSKYDEALQTVDEYSKIAGEGSTKLAHAFVYAHAQRKEESRRLLSEVINGLGKEYVASYYIALTYFALGENDKGFEWLNRGFDSYDNLLDLQLDPELDGVRTDVRYISLRTKMGFT